MVCTWHWLALDAPKHLGVNATVLIPLLRTKLVRAKSVAEFDSVWEAIKAAYLSKVVEYLSKWVCKRETWAAPWRNQKINLGMDIPCVWVRTLRSLPPFHGRPPTVT